MVGSITYLRTLASATKKIPLNPLYYKGSVPLVNFTNTTLFLSPFTNATFSLLYKGFKGAKSTAGRLYPALTSGTFFTFRYRNSDNGLIPPVARFS